MRKLSRLVGNTGEGKKEGSIAGGETRKKKENIRAEYGTSG